MVKKDDVNTGLYLVAMVGIVAVIGLVVLVMNSGGSSIGFSSSDLTGQAFKAFPQQNLQDEEVCTDSDGGIELELHGTTTGLYGDQGTTTESDYCLTSGPYAGQVVEYHCIDEWIQYHHYECPAGTECNTGQCVVQQICNEVQATDEGFQSIYDLGTNGEYITWQSDSGDIYYYEISSSDLVTLDSESYPYMLRPKIDGRYIVWKRYDGSDSDIFAYDLQTHTPIQITSDDDEDGEPSVSKGVVVWSKDTASSSEIYMHDISSQTTTQLTNNNLIDVNPMIQGNKIVWQQNDGNDYEIYAYDLSTYPSLNSLQITTDDDNDYYPKAYGDYIVWRSNSVDTELHLYDLDDLSLTSLSLDILDTSQDYFIYRDMVGWIEHDGNDYEVSLYDITSQSTTQLTNDDSNSYEVRGHNDWVVWRTDFNIFTYDISSQTTTQVTSIGHSTDPVIHDDLIVWSDSDEVYYLDLSTC